MRKILKLVLGLLLVGSMVFGEGTATESAQVIISTEVGETTANSGIKVVESYTGSSSVEFDAAFFFAGSTLSLLSGVDTSVNEASGNFTIMVRRPVNTSVYVAIGSTAMASGTSTIPYKISDADGVVYIDYVSETLVTSSYYITSIPSSGEILRDAKDFTYNIPVSTSAPLGTYSATITFSISVP